MQRLEGKKKKYMYKTQEPRELNQCEKKEQNDLYYKVEDNVWRWVLKLYEVEGRDWQRRAPWAKSQM